MREPLAWLHDQEHFQRENPKRRWVCPVHNDQPSPLLRMAPHCATCGRMTEVSG